MSVLAVMSYPGGDDTFRRHWPFFLRQQADDYRIITTTDGYNSEFPMGIGVSYIGENKYIDGPHLPNRMLDTIKEMLLLPWQHLIIAEYDCVFFKPIPVENVTTMAGHYAGPQTWGSKANSFYHYPHVFTRYVAQVFLKAGREAIASGICKPREQGQPPGPECSPDVFTGFVCEQYNIPIQRDVWREYSRNSLDLPGHLEEARQAYLDGVDVLHGVKTADELSYITGL